MQKAKAAAVGIVLAFTIAGTASAHDWKRPDLDSYYAGLKNPRSTSEVVKSLGCCSKEDCHETEADMRGNNWWARLGRRVRTADGRNWDWELVDWVKVPEEAVLPKQSNPTGSAVICHSISMSVNPAGGSNVVNVNDTHVFCFVPPYQY